ncbi:beta-mannosidase [Vespa crabro]|uniref:beta-mannosidase n=1 Tax=Vespa crabro TaxID=7445 RepID=UPI001F020102|nr:beta-mannosidase [Vespa crabro]
MSSNIENLTASEKEESEKMKKELEKMGIDRPNYNLIYMKQIINVIRESKEMANRPENNARNQKDLPYSTNNSVPDVATKAKSILETDNDRPKPSCSYSTYHNSSSESPNVRDKKNIMSRRKSSDDDVTDDGSDKYLSHQKSKNSMQGCSNSRIENKLGALLEHKKKLIRWRINPLDSRSDQNDVPLQQPRRPPAQERIPFRFCKDANTTEKGNKIMNELSIHLKEMADLWFSCHGSTQLKFRWGTPIQVDTDNNSLDRKPLMVATNFNELENISSNYDRANKRKAAWFINTAVSSSSSDDNDEMSLSLLKKTKIEDTNKVRKILYNKEPITQETDCLKQQSDKEDLLSNNNFNVINDNDTARKSINIKSLQGPKERSSEMLSNTKIETLLKSNVFDKNKTLSTYSSLKNHKDTNKNDVERSPNTSNKESLDYKLTTKEAVVELERIIDKDNEMLLNEDVVIKPLSLKSFSARLAKQCVHLKQVDAERKRKILSDQKEAQKKEDEEKEKRKQDFMKRRMQEIEETFINKEKAQSKDKRKDRLVEVLQSRNTSRTQKWKDQERKQIEKQNKEAVLQDNGNEDIIKEMAKDVYYLEKKVTCPICNKSFPSDKIENHAATCDQFEEDNEPEQDITYSPQNSRYVVKEKTKNSKTTFECNICSTFKTENGIDYEDHVNKCLQDKQNSPSRGTSMMINVPDSPVRSYQSISEQRTSNIDYNGQLISVRKAQVGRKRKHKSSNEKCQELDFPAIVPGGIYTDLTTARLIPNNLLAMNDIKNRWVGNQTVVYSKNFTGTNTFVNGSTIALIFHGLDTFATIFLNDHKVGETSNMFLKYIFYIEQYMKIGENTLKIVFHSPIKMANDLYKNQSLQYIVPPKCVPKEYNGECHVNHIRKMQASFSWDWGPAIPSMGIWKSVELISTTEILVIDITTDIYEKDNLWEIFITIFFEISPHKESDTIMCNIASKLYTINSIYAQNSSDIILQVKNRYATVSTILNVHSKLIDRWWPNGFGKQNLYTLKVAITTGTKTVNKYMRIGFRTIELVEEPLEKGLSFYFRVNGIPIFAKGSNFIPASIFPELTAKEDVIRNLLQSAKEAHMNMLRVWGGGMYESDLFYNLADEFGIMIWQDFMFACSMYPTSEEFLSSVKEEVIQNVRRLKNHASIVLWAGNNENEAALYSNWYGTGKEDIYKNDYIKLYVNLIKKEVEKLDPTRPFVVSSPSNGLYTKEYNYVGQNPYSNLYGDVHYYNYMRNGWDINQYPRSRFVSEYGFQSMPSIYTMLTAIENFDDLRTGSNFLKHRQHLFFGTEFMKFLISTNFIIPKSNNTIRDFMDFIYLSQINQAVSVKIQTESYRQARSELNALGEGFTMGALYWQLNDVWQAPSWSSIEYGGRWKILHYYAIEFFSPIIVTSHLSQAKELSIYIVSDKLYPINNCTLKLNIYNWNSMVPLHVHSIDNIKVEPNKAMRITSIWLDKFLEKIKCGTLVEAKKFCIIRLTLEDYNGLQIAPVNYVYPTVLKDVNIPLANVKIKINTNYLPGKLSNYPDYEIELTTNNIALFVWLEVKSISGRFSENGFHMFEQTKYIKFHAYEATTPNILRKNIQVTTLSDIYNSNRTVNMYEYFYEGK